MSIPDDDLVRVLRDAKDAQREELLAGAFARFEARLRSMVELRLDHRLRPRLSASDVIQNAFLEARRKLPRYLEEPRLPLYLWLRRITADAIHKAHRHHLGAKRRDARRDEPSRDVPGGLAASSDVLAAKLASDTNASGDASADPERRRALLEAIESLAPIDREVIALRVFEQLSAPEAARVLGIEPQAVRQRYVRALRRLKERMDSGRGEAMGR